MVTAPRLHDHNLAYHGALAALRAGVRVLPIRPDGSKQPALTGWKVYQHACPTPEDVRAWFDDPRRGLAYITGVISGGLIALDFDDAQFFETWRAYVRSVRSLSTLYTTIAEGYEERTPKGGRHLLFRCPEAFVQERKPGNQKLALRPAPPPKHFNTLGETREEGGLIIVYPSHGSVHPSGRPYYLLRGSVASIRTITAAQREQLYASVRKFDETPKREHRPQVSGYGAVFPVHTPAAGKTATGDRPGDLFNADPTVTWEQLLQGWERIDLRANGAGQLEGYWRHPGKSGPTHSATTNADGTDRLYVFTPSIGLPMNRYLSKFEYIVYSSWGGDFKAAAKALVERGYTNRAK